MSGVALWAGVALLGGLGAVARHVVDLALTRRTGGRLPLGILAVNLSGAGLLGGLSGLGTTGDTALLLGTAGLGAYTTFSTWMLDTVALAGAGRRGAAAANLAGSLLLGLAAVALGRLVGLAL